MSHGSHSACSALGRERAKKGEGFEMEVNAICEGACVRLCVTLCHTRHREDWNVGRAVHPAGVE